MLRLDRAQRAALLAFVVAGVTLLSQILVHRMVSAKLLSNYAFLVISLTMLGFALSGIVLSRWQDNLSARFSSTIASCAALFTLTLLGASWVLYRADTAAQWDQSRSGFFLAFSGFAPLALLFAVPFGFCGLVLGLLLSSRELPTRRVYFFDLLGSALGAALAIPAIRLMGVETAAIVGCWILIVVSAAIAPPRQPGPRALLGGAGVLLALVTVWPDMWFQPPADVEHTAWDPLARIEVRRMDPAMVESVHYPLLVGRNRQFHERFKRVISQNNFAPTFALEYDGDERSLTGIEETIYAAAYQGSSVTGPRVCVIGVGGGFDVLTALRFGATQIVGIEINGATVGILKHDYEPYFRPWVSDRRVQIVQGEGRHVLQGLSDSFDVLQLSGVDSYSGTPAAAHVFSENYLYTAEAFDLYLSRLSPDGILNMMRLEFQPPREMLRALTTAVGALRRAGAARPEAHVALLRATPKPNFTSLLVKKTPFTPAELQRLSTWASSSPQFELAAAPGMIGQRGNTYLRYLAAVTQGREAAFEALYGFDIRPATDNRPFFFRYSYWDHLVPGNIPIHRSVPAMEYSLIILTLIVGLVALVCIYVPLRYWHRRGERVPGARRYGFYCAAIAIGFMAIEIALLQRFGLFLGHPNYSLSVVLAAILVTAGLGSLYSDAIVARLGGIRFVAYLLAAALLLEYGLAFPLLALGTGLPFAVRVMLACALVAPLGLCMGVFFPSVLAQLKERAPRFVPWAWGLNGIFSVLAPVWAVGWSMTWGIGALFLAAAPIYLAAGLAFPEAPSDASTVTGAR